MNFKKLALSTLLALPLVGIGCGDDGGGDVTDDTMGDMCMTGESRFFVVNVLDVGQADPAGDPNLVPGFNLDMLNSTDEDPQGCFHPDFSSGPPDNIDGVDNQLGPILSSVGMSLDISGTIAEAIGEGSLLLLFEVDNVDDNMNDGCVTVNITLGVLPPGVDMPMTDGSGVLTGGQTFDIDDRSIVGGMPIVSQQGRIVNGRVQVGPVTLTLNLPIEDGLTLVLQDAQVRMDMAAGGNTISRGVLGGALDVEDTVSSIVALAPDDIPESLARSILTGQADLMPDAMGDCQAVSMGLVFDGVNAVEGNVVSGSDVDAGMMMMMMDAGQPPADAGGNTDAGADGG